MKLSLIDQRRLAKFKKILKKVNAYQEKMRQMSDEELQHQTVKFKKQLAAGKSLEDILPEAYATVREVDFRILGMFPFDVQVLGAIVMNTGNIAEMKTGEGKTLTATMPLYLNALSGKGAMLVTSNSYLAQRDAEEMGPVYRFLGLTVAVRSSKEKDEAEEELTVEEKRAIYYSDILYTTNDALGFDYLFNNLADRLENQYMRPFHFALIDEIDEILLDNSQMPLIISGAPHVQSNLYALAKEIVSQFEETKEFQLDKERKSVWLLPRGYKEIQRYVQTKKLFSDQYFELLKRVTLALQARMLHKKDKDYVVVDDEVLLVDDRSGRILYGNKLQLGIHQAIEAKEEVKISDLSKAMASITYQNLFRMFEKLAGMTGTGKVAEDEFIETYNMYVVPIPTNRPSIRKDLPDKIYTTFPEKLIASVEFIKELFNQDNVIFSPLSSQYRNDIIIADYDLFSKSDVSNLLDKCVLLNTYLSNYFVPKGDIITYSIYFTVKHFEKGKDMFAHIDFDELKRLALLPGKSTVYIDSEAALNSKAQNYISRLTPAVIGYKKFYEYNFIFKNLADQLKAELNKNK